MRRFLAARVSAAAIAVAALAGPLAGAASAQTFEHIANYDVAIAIQPDASLMVTEQITYDFGSTPHHGIFRDIPVRFDYAPNNKYERLTTIDDFTASATPAGTSAHVATQSMGREREYRIGDSKHTITGVHVYTLSYHVVGAFNAFADHDELNWNAVGTGWIVPIDAVHVHVTEPGTVSQVSCYEGPLGSQFPCQSAVASAQGATFAQDNLSGGESMTVVLALPKGEVTVPKPILDEKWAFNRAFAVTPATGGVTAVLLVVLIVGLIRLLRTGRDRRYRGSAVDVAFGNVSGEEEAVPLFERQHDPVEFEPPDKIRPGQLGTLIDESADPLDVTATIIDLAVRGYIRIEEIPKQGWHSKADWKLSKLKSSNDGLLAYEAKLIEGLFEAGDDVELSSLRTRFAARLKGVESALYDDVVAQGWFSRRPDQMRTKWTLLGGLALGLAVLLTVILAAATHAALVGVPLVIAGLVLILFAHRAPYRTPKGWATLRRVNGFRQFIEESEKERARFAERANIFSEYLPYAVVFGATEKWAKAFKGLETEVAATTSGWYISSNAFMLASFASSMDGFAVTTSGTIVASAPSSSGFGGGGGFSGGGFGGGGGGSW